MRLWSLYPCYLDAKGLVALWREGLLAQKGLRGKTRVGTATIRNWNASGATVTRWQPSPFTSKPSPTRPVSAVTISIAVASDDPGARGEWPSRTASCVSNFVIWRLNCVGGHQTNYVHSRG